MIKLKDIDQRLLLADDQYLKSPTGQLRFWPIQKFFLSEKLLTIAIKLATMG